MADETALELVRATGVATSLEQARPGQSLMIGPSGAVVGPHSIEVIAATLRAAAVVLAPGALVVILAGLAFGNLGLLAATIAAVIAAVLWAQPRFELGRALALHGRGDLENAELTARRVAVTGFASLMVRGNAWMIAGAADWLRGDLDRALASTRRAVADLGAPKTGMWRGVAALARLNEIQLLAIKGDLGGAKARLDLLERDGVPDGDLVQLQLADTKLVLAFEAGNPKMLPADLHEWMQMALRTNRFGSTLVLLAWALVKRGDAELVPMLLDVAADRLPECRIEQSHPRLARWLASMLAR